MRTKARQFIGAVAGAVLISQLASAQEAGSRAPPTATGETVEVNAAPSLIMTKPPRPEYPREANGVSGWVLVECLVSPKGRIQSVRVVESQPAGVFDQAAIDAMKAARFKPFKSAEPRLMSQRLLFSAN